MFLNGSTPDEVWENIYNYRYTKDSHADVNFLKKNYSRNVFSLQEMSNVERTTENIVNLDKVLKNFDIDFFHYKIKKCDCYHFPSFFSRNINTIVEIKDPVTKIIYFGYYENYEKTSSRDSDSIWDGYYESSEDEDDDIIRFEGPKANALTALSKSYHDLHYMMFCLTDEFSLLYIVFNLTADEVKLDMLNILFP